jgi:hypothetical protein
MPKALKAPQVETPLCQQNWEQFSGLFPIQTADLADKAITNAKLAAQIAYGYVNGTTGAIGIPGSNDWTSARTGVGLYTVTFTTAFTVQPVALATPAVTGGTYGLKVTASAVGSVSFASFATTTGGALDTDFMFIAIGTR